MVEQYDKSRKADVRKATTCDLCTSLGPNARAELRLRLPPRRRPSYERHGAAGSGASTGRTRVEALMINQPETGDKVLSLLRQYGWEMGLQKLREEIAATSDAGRQE